MLKAEQRLKTTLKNAADSGVSISELENIDIIKRLIKKKKSTNIGTIYKTVLYGLIVACLAYYWISSRQETKCLIGLPAESSKIFREPEDCKMCIGVTSVEKVNNISSEEFEDSYISKGRPVVVQDGTRDWSAVNTFSFKFFKDLYKNSSGGHSARNKCQFFPYKTEFKSLEEVFEMDEGRSRIVPGTEPWYIGWSNCDDEAGVELRKHYKRPYFLPGSSENMALSWIFIGGPGNGAHMHVDNVQFPSWQAQLKGRKTWRLAPPPECLFRCSEFKVTVEPGEIIVVDTNRWYHQTFIMPGDMSITIGAEFD